MNLSKLALGAANALRPVLTKIVPAKLLSSMKAKVVEKNTAALENISIVPFDKTKNEPGINFVGNIRGDNGLGQSMRLVSEILDESDWAYGINNFFVPPGGSMTNHTKDDKVTEEFKYSTNLIHVNASEFTLCYMELGEKIWNAHYNIAYWLWELEDFPEEWLNNINIVDEIWTPAEFISNTLRKYTDKPVTTVPYAVSAPTDDKFDRAHFGLPKDKFLFLMMFASGSIMERKNPLGTIESFKKAFGKDRKDVGLVIKINEKSAEDEAYVRKLMEGYDNIYIISETLSKVEVNSLVKAVDVFVSLHRAEGFGLVLAEAMLVGTPTIATNWSANTEFMDADSACMVDYKMIELKEDLPPFKKGYRWADADVNQASQYMARLADDKEFYEKIKANGLTKVKTALAMEKSVSVVNKRLGEIYGK